VVDEKGKEESWIARNFAYKPVILQGKRTLGDTVQVTIGRTTIHDLRAE
jgi:hypothetical protein